NYLYGGQGDDSLQASGTYQNVLDGGTGNDALRVDGGTNNYLYGGQGDDTLTGGTGNDTLDGGTGNNQLQGGGGDDTLSVSDNVQVNNTLDGGAGNDRFLVNQTNAGSVSTLAGGEGRDTYLLRPDSLGELRITDFAGGVNGDVLSIDSLLVNSTGYSEGNPFDPALGYLRLVQQGVDTLLQWDRDGSSVATQGWRTVAILQNTQAASLTIDNFAPATSITAIEIVETNAAPTVTGPVTLPAGTEDSAVTLTAAQLLANAHDVDVGDTLHVQSVGVNQADGTLAYNGNGTWTFTPVQDRNGAVNFAVTIADAAGATVNTSASINLAPVNDAPNLANVIAEQSAGAGTAFSYSMPANTFADVDGDTLSYSAALADGTPLPTWLSFNPATRTFSGTPDSADVGNLSVRVTATDTGGLSASGQFTLTVAAADNQPPTTTHDSLTSAEDAVVVLGLNDFGDYQDAEGSPLAAVKITTLPVNGQLQYFTGVTWVAVILNQMITSADILAGHLRFVPGQDEYGDDYAQVGFQVSDGNLLSASTYMLTIDLTPLNDAPTGTVSISGTALQGETLTASHNLVDADGLGMVVYQWQRSPDGITWSNVSGAVGSSLVLDAGLLGQHIRVLASYTDGGGTAESVSSIATATVTQSLNPISGSDGDDNPLYGTEVVDLIHAKAGNDVVYAKGGDDVVYGEGGDDTLYGEDGNDSLLGGGGTDYLSGGEGDDSLTLDGATGISYANGDGGADTLMAYNLALAAGTYVYLQGGAGSDTYRVDDSGNINLSDDVDASTSNDFNVLELATGILPSEVSVSSDGYSATLTFGNGNTLWLVNQVFAYQPTDTQQTQYGVQEIHFADGTVWDRQAIREMAGYYVGADATDDSISTGAGTQYLYGHGGNDTLQAGEGNDYLSGGLGDDVLQGEAGDDTLYGEDGNDSLLGGGGADTLSGGEGDDSLTLDGATGISYANGDN
ncbi:tandem-95 repeat protein, partial [Aeromonas sanarellii]